MWCETSNRYKTMTQAERLRFENDKDIECDVDIIEDDYSEESKAWG